LSLFILPTRQVFTPNGIPIPNARVFFYRSGTLTPVSVYADAGLTTPLPNPVPANSAGQLPPIYLRSDMLYRIRIETKLGVLIDDIDSYGELTELAAAGIIGDGVTPVGNALAAAGDAITLPKGTYRISSNTTLLANISMQPGAAFTIDAGATLTLAGPFDAPIAQVFKGAGTVLFAPEAVPHVYPEWWGGAPQNGVDYLPHLNAAMAAHRNIRLQLSDYYIADTWQISIPRTKVIGSSLYWGAIGQATRVVVMNGSNYVITMGLKDAPLLPGGATNINALAGDMRLENVEITRSTPPVKASGCMGVMVQYCQDAVVERVKCTEHMVGFGWQSNVNLRMTDCRSYRTAAGTGPDTDTDYWYGYQPITGAHPLTAINSNASCWLNRCIAGCSPERTTTVGLFLGDLFCDTFVDEFETAGPRIGIRIRGDGAATNSSTTAQRTNANVRLHRIVIDQCGEAGVRIDDLNRWGSVRMTGDFYCGPSAGALAAVHIMNCNGMVYVGPGELAMASAATTRGALVVNSRKVTFDRTQVIECGYRGIDVGNSSGVTVLAEFTNETSPMDQAVLVTGTCSQLDIEPKVTGAAGKCGAGISVEGTGTTRSKFEVSQIDSTVATQKLLFNGAAVTTEQVVGASSIARGNFA
jgi:hypothetical protein